MTKKEAMKKEQLAINEEINAFMENHETLTNLFDLIFKHHIIGKRLRTSSAYVYTCGGYSVLRSYNTIISIITPDGTCYDFLRKVYGYTATSAQHITKFMEDYNAKKLLRYYSV